MRVTKVVVNNICPKDQGVCGEFTVTLDDALCIHKVLAIKGEKGMFITYPSVRGASVHENKRRYLDVVHPTDNTLRQHIQDEVLKRYYEEIK